MAPLATATRIASKAPIHGDNPKCTNNAAAA